MSGHLQLTERQCISAQRRHTDACGAKHPYHGYIHGYGSAYPCPTITIPKGWVLISIPTWGIYVRRINDTDGYKELTA